jgi:oligoendopeptidase F
VCPSGTIDLLGLQPEMLMSTLIPSPAPKLAPTLTSIPPALAGDNFQALEPHFKELLARPVASRGEFEQWLVDRSELAAACSETRANLYITMTCDTEDKAASAAYAAYIEEVEPKLKPLSFELDKRLAILAAQIPLPADRYAVLERGAKAEVELFRAENIPLETQLAKLTQDFETLAGGMSVQFEGQERTLPQMARYQEQTDRSVREAAWRTVAQRRFQEVEKFNAIYGEMLALRTRVARQAGFENYIGYAFKSKHRFDYDVQHCLDFHAGVEAAVVPLSREVDKLRKAELGVDALRPWDLSVDPKGRGPLKPFTGGRELMGKAACAMDSLDPRLGAMLRELGDGSETRGARDGACLDLDSRKGAGRVSVHAGSLAPCVHFHERGGPAQGRRDDGARGGPRVPQHAVQE